MARSFTARSNWGQDEQAIARLCVANSVAVGTRRGLPIMLDGKQVGCAHDFEAVPPAHNASGIAVGLDGYLLESHVRYDVDLAQDVPVETLFEIDSLYDGRRLIGCEKVEVVANPRFPPREPKGAAEGREVARLQNRLAELEAEKPAT